MQEKKRILKVNSDLLDVYYFKFIKIYILVTLYQLGYNLVTLTILLSSLDLYWFLVLVLFGAYR